MHEMHVDSIDLGQEMVVCVDLRLEAPPVIRRGPVVAQLLDVGQRSPLAPVIDHFFLRPTRPCQTLTQIGDLSVRDGHGKRADVVTHAQIVARVWG